MGVDNYGCILQSNLHIHMYMYMYMHYEHDSIYMYMHVTVYSATSHGAKLQVQHCSRLVGYHQHMYMPVGVNLCVHS